MNVYDEPAALTGYMRAVLAALSPAARGPGEGEYKYHLYVYTSGDYLLELYYFVFVRTAIVLYFPG